MPLDLLKRNPNCGLAARFKFGPRRICGSDEQRCPREYLISNVRQPLARLFNTAQSQHFQNLFFGSQDPAQPGPVRRAYENRPRDVWSFFGPAIAAKASLWSRPHVDASPTINALRILVPSVG